MAQKILIIEPSENIREKVRVFVSKLYPDAEAVAYDVQGQGAPTAGFDWAGYSLLIMDSRLSKESGISTLDWLRDFGTSDGFPPVIFLSSQNKVDVAVEAMKLGARDYILKKGIKPGRLKAAIEAAMPAEEPAVDYADDLMPDMKPMREEQAEQDYDGSDTQILPPSAANEIAEIMAGQGAGVTAEAETEIEMPAEIEVAEITESDLEGMHVGDTQILSDEDLQGIMPAEAEEITDESTTPQLVLEDSQPPEALDASAFDGGDTQILTEDVSPAALEIEMEEAVAEPVAEVESPLEMAFETGEVAEEQGLEIQLEEAVAEPVTEIESPLEAALETDEGAAAQELEMQMEEAVEEAAAGTESPLEMAFEIDDEAAADDLTIRFDEAELPSITEAAETESPLEMAVEAEEISPADLEIQMEEPAEELPEILSSDAEVDDSALGLEFEADETPSPVDTGIQIEEPDEQINYDTGVLPDILGTESGVDGSAHELEFESNDDAAEPGLGLQIEEPADLASAETEILPEAMGLDVPADGSALELEFETDDTGSYDITDMLPDVKPVTDSGTQILPEGPGADSALELADDLEILMDEEPAPEAKKEEPAQEEPLDYEDEPTMMLGRPIKKPSDN